MIRCLPLLLAALAWSGEAAPMATGLPPILDVAQMTFRTPTERSAGMRELQRLEATIALVTQRQHAVGQEDDAYAWASFRWLSAKVENQIQSYKPWYPDQSQPTEVLLDQGLVHTYGYNPFKEPTPPWVQEWANLRRAARTKADVADGLEQTRRDLERLRDQLAAALGVGQATGR